MKSIGVFDSGIGGLTVVKELMRQLPHENIVYLGDTAHVPYGIKSAATITRFTLNNILFLLKQNVKLIVIACNSASSLALREIRDHFSVPIIGVIEPGAREAARATKTNCVGVIGTKATVNSGAYEKEIRKINRAIKVVGKPCPMFVPLVEEGWLNQAETASIAKKYLLPLVKKNRKIDTLILGCTHYPLLKTTIRKVLGKRIRLIDSAQQVVRGVKETLENKGIININSKRKAKHKFYVTDDPEGFAHQAESFLGEELSQVKRISYV